MANNAARQIERQPRVNKPAEKPNRQVRQGYSPEQQALRKLRNVFVTGIVSVSACLSIWLLYVQANNYEMNTNIQQQEAKITQQVQTNSDLKANVDELSRYDRVYKEANKNGLKSNENNVKAVDIK